MYLLTQLLGLHVAGLAASPGPVLSKRDGTNIQIKPRQAPAEATDVQTIVSPSGVNITYKEPGAEGICETTEGVRSFTGFVNLAEDVHSFFWFFESRNDPANDPITLWLNGGPGSDSLLGLFQELGPCNVTEELETQLNQYSWNEVSNLMFLSQPVGVGFSYGHKEEGDVVAGQFQNATQAENITGRYPLINATAISTTELAAIAAWEVLQGFFSALPELSPDVGEVTNRPFHLATQSYGGHWGPTFYRHFVEQNQKVANGSLEGIEMNMDSLLIVNGLIDEAIQAPYYPTFAANNTYDATPLNQTVLDFMWFANDWPQGCQAQLQSCAALDRSTLRGTQACSSATFACRNNVEYPWYSFSELGTYDIRVNSTVGADDPPTFFIDYLNQASIQEALGVDTNYTSTSNNEVYNAFQQSGDFVYPNFLEDLEWLLEQPVRINLVYGDSDYICNWYGGEAVALAANYSNTESFNAAGYTPL